MANYRKTHSAGADDSLLKKLESVLNTMLARRVLVNAISASQFYALEKETQLGTRQPKDSYEIASLSKTIGTAFAIEFLKTWYSLSSSANKVLERCGSTLRLGTPQTRPLVTKSVCYLMSHCALICTC